MKFTACAIILACLVLLFGCPQVLPSQPAQNASGGASISNSSQQAQATGQPQSGQVGSAPAANATTQVQPPAEETQQPQQLPALRVRAGYVNISALGNDTARLVVSSPFQKEANFTSVVNRTGYFNTTVSADFPHLVFLKDRYNNTIRAMAVSLPLDPRYLVLDVRSTAKATLWAGGALDERSNEKLLAKIETLGCWGDYFSYLGKYLPRNSVENLTDHDFFFNKYRNACIAELNSSGYPVPELHVLK